jgi:CO/xanthine dehydrogenase FAD-binding subunit
VRSRLEEFGIAAPTSLEEALALLGEPPPGRSATPLAGATDLYVLLNAGQLEPTTFVSLLGVPELAPAMRWAGDRLSFGALTTYTETRRDPHVRERLPLLAAASRELGALQIQNRGTWAGNVANASPAADGVPVLLAYDAVLDLASRRGVRQVPLDAYFTGYRKSVRAPDEIIVCLSVRAPGAGARHFFRKVGTRRLQAISKVVAAGVLEFDPSGAVARARLSFGSVAPVTVRARRVEALITGQRLAPGLVEAACRAVHDDVSPIDDLRSTRAYRAALVERLTRAFLVPEPA